MKWMKRTFTSIFRKPAQSILMFVIVFVLGNVLFASIAIKQTSEDVKLEMRARIPSYLNINKTNHHNSNAIYIKMIDLISELEKDERVIGVTEHALTSFDHVVVYDESDPFYDPEEPYEVYSTSMSGVYDVNRSIYEYEIVEGRYFTQEELDNGERKILIDIYDAQYENINIGDKISRDIYNYKIEDNQVVTDFDRLIHYEFEVIGIYSSKDINSKYQIPEDNKVLYTEVPGKCLEEIYDLQNEVLDNHTEEEKRIFEDLGYGSYRRPTREVTFMQLSLKGIDASEQMQEELLNNMNYPKSYYSLTSAIEDYRYVQAPLENLVALANVALWASVVLIVVLLGLVSILFIRNRTFEIGVLMAMGERKMNILLQFVCEIVLVGLLATSLSMVSGNKLGSAISEEFMRIQIDTDYEMEYQEKNPDMVTQLDLLETYHIEMDASYVGSIYAVSAFILIVSSAAPVLYILNINPKKVLM